MSSQTDRQDVFIDDSLIQHSNFILSCLEAISKLNQQNFYFFFLTDEKSDNLFQNIDKIRIKYKFEDENFVKMFVSLKNHLKETTTSFSWGCEELELIFIILSKEESNFLEYPPALVGLLIHETLHSIERQRGLEDDLKRSLAISMETFQKFADLLSQTSFKKETLIDLFKEIGETATYVLKDLYVDREAIERGFVTEVLEQYKSTFNLNDDFNGSKLPAISLELFDIDPKNVDLEEFKLAFIILLGLIPTWLPFIRISKGYEHEQALELRSFIDTTYKQVSLISERFHHLENMYFTDFSFTRSFHTKWLSEVFSIAVDILSGGEFIIWQFSKFVIDLENYATEIKEIEDANDTYSIKDLIIVPVLKAAYIFSKTHTGLDPINKEIDSKLKGYIQEDELLEWEQDYQEYTIESLLLFVLSELTRLLRQKFLDSIQNLRFYTSFILNTLQILIDIKTDIIHLDKYVIFKNSIHQFIIERDSRFLSLKILYPMEAEIEQLLFEEVTAFTPDEADEFLQIGRFYGLPKLNWVLEIAKRIASIVKISLQKSKEKNEPLGLDVIGLTMMALTKDFEGITNTDLLIPIARSTLMALKTPTYLMKEIVKIYGDLISA